MNIASNIRYQEDVAQLLVNKGISLAKAKDLVESNREKACSDWAVGWKTPEMTAQSLFTNNPLEPK